MCTKYEVDLYFCSLCASDGISPYRLGEIYYFFASLFWTLYKKGVRK